MLLSDFVANSRLKSELAESMKNRTLPHAIIIDGAKGTGKKTLANIIAQYCVCSSVQNKPCGICSGCLKAQKGIHPDIFTVDGLNSGTLSVDSVRNIRSDAFVKPNESPMKVYLLFNCEKMLVPAQNAFLKILEEPPKNVVFIMTVSSAASMLQTIRSRARIFSLYSPSVSETVEFISKKFPERDIEEIRHCSSVCDGNIGLALQMLQDGGEDARILAENIFKAIPLSTEYQLLTLTNELSQNRAFAVSVLDCMTEISADSIKASAGFTAVSEVAGDMADRYNKQYLFLIADNIKKARDILNLNVNLNFFGTWFCSVLRKS